MRLFRHFVYKLVPIQNQKLIRDPTPCDLESHAKYQDPSLGGSSDVLFTRLFLYKMTYTKGV